MIGRIWLGRAGLEVLMPNLSRKFSEEDTEISKESRTASGRLVIDVVAIKKVFTLEYSTVTGDVLETLKTVYALGGILSLKVERKDGTIDIYTVRMRPFGRKRVLMAIEWLWDGITVKLEEI
jgi:hypothetical protein